jgi:carbon monoxide dehydrogenase subunit G
MRLHEEFEVHEPVAAVWNFFEQAELVARCMPGIEAVEILDSDNVNVRATQSIGPMSATFETRVTVLDRVPNELIRFQATGRSIRGAIGNVRTVNAVRLRGVNGTTTVEVDGDVILAGALGSVGQKVVARQAGRVTAEFADNLRRALAGDLRAVPAFQPVTGPRHADGQPAPRPTLRAPRATWPAPATAADPWVKAAAVLSAVSVILSGIALARARRPAR